MRARFNLRCVVDGQISGDSPPNIAPPAASLNMSTPGCRHNSRARPRRRDRLKEAFSNRPRDGNRQPTNSCLFPAGMAPGKRERGLGATRLVPNDPFCPLPIRGRHGNEPRLPEAREMGRRQSPLPNPPPPRPRKTSPMPDQEEPGEADQPAVSCQKKKLYGKSSLCN